MTSRVLQKFQVGDVVPWGSKRIVHHLVEEQTQGGVGASLSAKFGQQQREGRLFTFSSFVSVHKYGMVIGPPEHTVMKPEALAR